MPDDLAEAQQKFKHDFEGIVRDAVRKTEDVVLDATLTVCRKVVLGQGSALDCVRSLMKMKQVIQQRRTEQHAHEPKTP